MNETTTTNQVAATSEKEICHRSITGKHILIPLFFLILVIGPMILDMYLYEFGHGISAELGGGWQNNVSVMGETFFFDPSYFHWLQQYMTAHHATIQQYFSNQLPSSFDNKACIQAFFRQQPGLFWGFAGAFIVQGITALCLFAYSTTPWFQKGSSDGSKLFLSIFIVMLLTDLSMRLINTFTSSENDDLGLLRVAIFDKNIFISSFIVLIGILLAILVVHISRTQLTFALAHVTQASFPVAQRSASVLVFGLLLANFALRFHPLAYFLPGILYSLTFIILFLGTAWYAGDTLVRRTSTIQSLAISAHTIFSYIALVGIEFFFISQQIGIITGAAPDSLLHILYP